MPDTKVPVADVPRVLDHEALGRAVLQWALMIPDDRPKTVDQLKAWFPEPDMVIAFPAHIAPDHQVSMFQGTPDTMVINLPPLHKLLPMEACPVNSGSSRCGRSDVPVFLRGFCRLMMSQ